MHKWHSICPTNRMRILLLLVSLPIYCTAQSAWKPLGQRISIGAIGGTNLTPDARTNTSTTFVLTGGSITTLMEPGPHRFVGGATIEWDLPKQFSVEFDALYRPLTLGSTTTVVPSDSVQLLIPPSPVTSVRRTWEFPLLFKRHFTLGALRPFVAAGPSFRSQIARHYSQVGVVAGAGVEFRWGVLKIAPTIRYTHWGEQPSPAVYRQNQSEILVGFSF